MISTALKIHNSDIIEPRMAVNLTHVLWEI